MTRRRGRTGQRGAQTLELMGLLPLLGLAFLLIWQGVVLVRQQVEAQSDARELARRAALCGRAASPATLALVDGAPGTATTTGVAGHGDSVRVEVTLVPHIVLPGLTVDAASGLVPRAVVVMRREPC